MRSRPILIFIFCQIFSLGSFYYYQNEKWAGVINGGRESYLSELNLSTARAQASFLKSYLFRLGEKIRLTALTELAGDSLSLQLSSTESELFSPGGVKVFRWGSEGWLEISSRTKIAEPSVLAEKWKTQLSEALKSGLMAWPVNSPSLEKQDDKVYVAVSLKLEAGGYPIPYVAVANTTLNFADGSPKESRFVTLNIFQGGQVQEIPLVRGIASLSSKAEVRRYFHQGERWIGSYSPVGVGGYYVASQSREADHISLQEKVGGEVFWAAILVLVASIGLFAVASIPKRYHLFRKKSVEAALEKSEFVPGESAKPETPEEVTHTDSLRSLDSSENADEIASLEGDTDRNLRD